MDYPEQDPTINTPEPQDVYSSAPTSVVVDNTQPSLEHPKRKIFIGIIVAVALLVGAFLAYIFLIDPSENSNTSMTQNDNKSFYIPAEASLMNNAIFTENINNPEDSNLLYTIGEIQFGEGLLRGVYQITQFQKTDRFNPPETCRFGPGSSSAVDCSQFNQTILEGEVYVYDGQRPGSIQNTTVNSYITVFALIGDLVIQVETADTTAAEVVNLLESFVGVSTEDLPSSVTRKTVDTQATDEVLASDLDWSYAPTYIPEGVNDFHRCGTNRANGPTFICTFLLNDLPGFLSDSSYSHLVENYARSDGEVTLILDFTSITQFQYQDSMEQHLYRDETCDIQAMFDIARATDDPDILAERAFIESLSDATPRTGNRCIELTTPGGRQVVYDSFENYENAIEIPKTYYFRIEDTIVMMNMDSDDSWESSVTTSSLVQADGNFLDELFKFVDGFEKVR